MELSAPPAATITTAGETAVFADHRQALAGLPGGCVDPGADSSSLDLQRIAVLARAAGYDSVRAGHRALAPNRKQRPLSYGPSFGRRNDGS
jgi:hypothetical protein